MEMVNKMQNRARNKRNLMAAITGVLLGIVALSPALYPVEAPAQDFSNAYRYGGGVNIPGVQGGGSDGAQEIVDVSAGIDAGGVLGCSGLDLGGMIQNTLDVGDLAGEFQDYLKNTLATEALSLLYSQPGVSQVLDGLKAVGHARASILQEKCNANEIMADATNQRLKSEAQDLCLEDTGSMVECEGEADLAPYIEQLEESKRWSGTLHDHICPEDEDGNRSATCKFIPNFSYDVGAKSGRGSEAGFKDKQVRDSARSSAFNCLQTRAERASLLAQEKGYACARQLLGTGAVKLSCKGDFTMPNNDCRGAGAPTGGTGAGGTGTGGTPGQDAASNPDESNPAAAGLSPAESCVVEKPADNPDDPDAAPTEISVDDLAQAIEDAGNMNIEEIIASHTECIIGKEVHSHVDLNIALSPGVDALAAMNGLSEVFATKAFLDLNAMRIRKLSQTIVNSGGRDAASACPRDDEGNKEDPSCHDTPPPQQLDKAASLLRQFRDEQQAALADLEMSEKVADRIDRMNKEQERRIQQATDSKSRAAQRGGRIAGQASQQLFYPDFFE